ncbi:MAG: polyamine aminopropyltransferase [Candidatus Pacebacteria bacterium]|nr:polyamine aminopropyltransferase [Candidatus Paceibacterota bacterium]
MKRLSLVLWLCMFITGATGLIDEYIIGTVATYILGHSIFQITMTIGVMMLMMGVGALFQRFIPERNNVESFITLEFVLALFMGFAPTLLYLVFAYASASFGVALYGSMALIGLLIGLEIPLVMRMNKKAKVQKNAAVALSSDYIGAFIGALIWGFLILKTGMNITEMAFVVGLANLIVAGIALFYFSRYKKVRYSKFFKGVGILVFVALGWGYFYGGNIIISAQQELYREPIVERITTKYQDLVVTQHPETQSTRLFINGNLQFSSTDEKIYHEYLTHPAFQVNPVHGNVLILGGGDGLALREVLKYDDVHKVTLVDLDPDMIKLCASNKFLRAINQDAFQDARVYTMSPQLEVIDTTEIYRTSTMRQSLHGRTTKHIADVQVLNMDADKFVEQIPGLWDVIIIDFPDPNSIELAKLYSWEFYKKIQRVLAPGGVMIQQCTSPYHAKEAFHCMNRTMQSAGLRTLPYHANVPSFGEWGWVMAWNDERSVNDIKNSFSDNLDIDTTHLSSDLFLASTVFGKDWHESEFDDINSLMNPVLFRYYYDLGWKM